MTHRVEAASRRKILRRALLASLLAVVLVGGASTAAFVAGRGFTNSVAPQRVVIAVVGDSYTAGRNNQVVWPTLLAQRTGWKVANFALPDSGFAADGQGGHAFGYQVNRAQAVNPRVIVVMSGVADAEQAYSGAVEDGAADVITRIVLGGQQALMIGPTWYEPGVPDAIRKVSDAVKLAADNAHVPYLDALDPPWLSVDDMQADLRGVTDEGQSVIADRVAAWLNMERP